MPSKVFSTILSFIQHFDIKENLPSVGMVVGIIGGIFGIIVGLKHHFYEKKKARDKVFQHINNFYQEEARKTNIKDLKKAKLEFYECRSRLSPIENVALGFHIERDTFFEIFNTALKSPTRTFTHVEVIGGRKQGTATLLAHLTHKLRESNNNIVLYHRGNISEGNTLDWGFIYKYRLIKFSRFYRILYKILAILNIKTRRIFAIVIDNFTGPWEEKLTKEKEIFLDAINKLANKKFGPPIILITSSDREIGNNKSLKYSINFTPNDEDNIIHKLSKEEPVLISESMTTDKARSHTGGYRIYKNEISAFLSLLIQIAIKEGDTEFSLTIWNLEKELKPENKNALKYIASCQILDIELIPRVLELLIPQFNPHDLINEADGWIRYQRLSFADKGSGYALGAPYFAESILNRVFQISNSVVLESIYLQIFETLLKNSNEMLTRGEMEFLRHILYRLSKGRHFHFHNINGVAIARVIFDKYGNDVIVNIIRQSEVNSLCLWAATITRVGKEEQVKNIFNRIIAMIKENGIQLSPQAFVSMLKALSNFADDDLSRESLKVIDFKNWILSYKQSKESDFVFRANQIIHSYISLLNNLEKYPEALAIINEMSNKITLDARSFLLKAEVLEALGSNEVKYSYENAINLAKDSIRRDPAIMADCFLSYARYLAKLDANVANNLLINNYFILSIEYSKYLPEKQRKIFIFWVDCLMSNDDPNGCQSCLKMIEEYLIKNPSDKKVSRLVSKLVLGRDRREIEGNLERLRFALDFSFRVFQLCPDNNIIIEGFIRIGDVVQNNENKIDLSLKNKVMQFISSDMKAGQAFDQVLKSLVEKNHRGRFTNTMKSLRFSNN
jgi:hypothetical protein